MPIENANPDETSIPANIVAADSITVPFAETVPEAYRGKPYLADIDSMEKVYAKLDGSQQLLGKRPSGVPDKNAPAEEWDTFFNNAGRPESAEKYEIAGLKEGQEEVAKELKDLFYKSGLSSEQAKTLQEGYDGIINKAAGKQGITEADNDKEFGELTSTYFGEKQETVIALANKMIAENIPENLKPFLENLDNKALVLLAATLDGVRNKYIKEDDGGSLGGDIISGGESKESLQAEARAIMMKPEYSNAFHPLHQGLMEKKNAIYAKIASITKK